FRLLRSGGTIGNLDIYNPTAPGFSQLFGAYFYHLVPFVGNSLTGSKAYSYLAKSVLNFYSPGRVSELLKEAGFVSVRMKPMMLGAIVLHWGMKP
ncbi:MAG TPA: class I SAM-dependent methyltransferase, partial [Thermoplasmataceae archaeon]|nr:class I SAM-dependent methyltransferase [Thermoplasmataceae archaeon]